MKMIKLTKNEIEANLSNLRGWSYSENGLFKEFEFENFINFFAFMTKVALISEKLNHHPQWCGGYRKMTITLFTNDVNGITKLDIEAAKMIEKINTIK